jgi:PAS domain S-box-containing protein
MRRNTIRSRILAGYGIMVAILVIVAVWSGFKFWRFRSALRAVLTENYRSVVAAESMVAALERQDSGVLLYVAGEVEVGESIASGSQADFFQWYGRAVDNITIPGEKDILASINEEYGKYSSGYLTLRDILARQGPEAARRYYLDQELPAFTRIRQLCADLQGINQENMMNADTVTEREATRAIVSVSAFTLVAALMAIVFASVTLRSVLSPIDRLKDEIGRISEGRLDEDIQITSADELGSLAQEFQRMVNALRERERTTVDRFSRQRAKLEATVRSMNDGVIVTDADFKIDLLNPVAEQIIGLDDDEARGKHFLEVLDDQTVFDAVKRSVSARKPLRESEPDASQTLLEHTTKRQGKDETQYYAVNASPIRGRDGVLAGVVVVFTDVTRYKEVDELKSHFVATVSHQFRTPLTSIAMSVGLLLEVQELQKSPKVKQLLEIIRDDSDRLARMVSELLDLSRIQAGKIEIKKTPVRMQTLADEVLRPFNEQFKSQSVNLVTDIEQDCLALADADKIAWVISNLVANALRYTPEGGNITVGARTGDRDVHVFVSDTGRGIAEEYQTRIFEKFVQVADGQAVPSHGGAGLGLAICKEMVEAHGGRIWVESQPGHGSRFVFTLPKVARIEARTEEPGDRGNV